MVLLLYYYWIFYILLYNIIQANHFKIQMLKIEIKKNLIDFQSFILLNLAQ